MGTLQGFIDAVVTELRTVTGIKYVPADPPGRLSTWPSAPVWATVGTTRVEFGEVVTYQHDIRVGILGPAEDLTRLSRVLTAYIEPVINNIYGKYLAKGFTDISAMGDISYIFGPIEWAGSTQFGFILTIRDVVIRDSIT